MLASFNRRRKQADSSEACRKAKVRFVVLTGLRHHVQCGSGGPRRKEAVSCNWPPRPKSTTTSRSVR